MRAKVGTIEKSYIVMLMRGEYRLVDLYGSPHRVLDAPYETIEAAMCAAKDWCQGQGLNSPLSDREISVEVLTDSGDWRTVRYPS